MIIVVDFDDTVATSDPYPWDEDEALALRPGAAEALRALRAAGHVLLLSSARSNMAHRLDWRLNPLWVSGAVRFDLERWRRQHEAGVWEKAHRRMEEFVARELPGVFHAVDQGLQGKPGGDLYLDDKGFRMAHGASWARVAELYGEADDAQG